MGTRVGIVVLGDEVLGGEIRESNLGFLIPLLNGWGAEVALCAILPDEIETVARHLAAYRAEAELLILTGGIGPTPDDITRDAVARVAGVPLVVHPEARALLERYYGDRINENRLLMARVPEGAELIPNPVSAAPGFYIAGMAAFPGIPRLLHEMIGWLKPRVRGARPSRVTLYSSAPESSYAGIMRDTVRAFPEVRVGSYPMLEGGYRVRVVFRAGSLHRASDCADWFAKRMAAEGLEVTRRTEEAGEETG
ncbi:MAG: molybdopterin-binding protein [Deltaproteobacteria bacterium]